MIDYRRFFKAIAFTALVASGPALTLPPALASEDVRQLVQLAPDIRDRFLAEMRQDLVHLDDVLSAITEGDMEEVARIAERRMGLGHKRIARMEQQGATDEEISLLIARIRKMVESEDADLPNALHGAGQGGRGIGRFMPEELRAMGQEMHKAAYQLADAARAAKKPPLAEDYKKLISAVNDITTLCRGCHDTFRVK